MNSLLKLINCKLQMIISQWHPSYTCAYSKSETKTDADHVDLSPRLALIPLHLFSHVVAYHSLILS